LPNGKAETEFPTLAMTVKPTEADSKPVEAERETMKVSVQVEATVARSIATRYQYDAFQNALDSEYNKVKTNPTDDGLAVTIGEGKIKSAKATEAKGAETHGKFKSKDGFEVEREGRLNMPYRWIAWLTAWSKFTKANGSPSGEMEFTTTESGLLTHPVIPAGLLVWLEASFLKDEFKPKAEDKAKAKAAGHARRNGGVKSPTATVPA
jgi:hypothetical protein